MAAQKTNGVNGTSWRPLKVGIIGGGIGGLSAAISLRRQGHHVSVYEKRDFDLEVGASLSVAANGAHWLRRWGVNTDLGRPVTLTSLRMRDYRTGEIISTYPLDDYEQKWGIDYRMYHRVDMHRMLLQTALDQAGPGEPVKLVTNHPATSVDCERGIITFEDGSTVQVDLLIGADGVNSYTRQAIGVETKKKPADVACYRCNIETEKVKELGLVNFAGDQAIDYWGGFEAEGLHKYLKLVVCPCKGGELLSFYIFFPAEWSNHHKEGFVVQEVSHEELLAPYKDLDPKIYAHLANSIDRMPWRFWIHEPYSHWTKGRTLIMGDAAHPMLPNQSQGACSAIEDAGALGIIFSPKYNYTNDIEAGVKLYEQVRKERATKIQASSIRATENLNERLGFTSLAESAARTDYKGHKLTIEEVNGYDMAAHIQEVVAAA